MDAVTCKTALDIATAFMSPKQLVKYTAALRKVYLMHEVKRVTELLQRPKQPVVEYQALSKSLPVLQQQLASITL